MILERHIEYFRILGYECMGNNLVFVTDDGDSYIKLHSINGLYFGFYYNDMEKDDMRDISNTPSYLLTQIYSVEEFDRDFLPIIRDIKLNICQD